MGYPESLRYTKTHEWIRQEGELAVVGITDYAIDQLGDVVFLDLPDVGSQAECGQRFGEIESTKTVSDLVAPVSGEIVEVHTALVDELSLLKESPYEKGWILKIRPKDSAELEALLAASDYAAHVDSEEH